VELPEAVSVIDPENGYLGVSYTSLIPVLVEAIKEQQEQIDSLEAENAAKDAELENLREGIEIIKQRLGL
jgi:cell division protein FtsB